MPLPRESVSSSQGLRIGAFIAMPQATVTGAESARPNSITTPTIRTDAATADQTAMARAADSILPPHCTSAASAARFAFTAAPPAKARAAPSILSGFTILSDPRDSHHNQQTHYIPMQDLVAKVNNTGQLSLYDARTGGHVRLLNSTLGKYTSAVVSGSTVQAHRADGKVDTYDAQTGRFLRTI